MSEEALESLSGYSISETVGNNPRMVQGPETSRHDLNNILTPIMMAVEILKMNVEDEESEGILDTLEECAQRGTDLVRQVLSFARGMEGTRVTVNLRHLGQEVGKIIGETFPKSVRFDSQFERGLWPVLGDPTQLHQVLMNLCVNARDAMPGGGNLSLNMRNVVIDQVYADMSPDAHPGQHVVIEVVDTGTGIPTHIREKVFEPFFTTKDLGVGTGLGLSTTSAIVKGHNGFMTLYSEIGHGTTFKIYLPAEAALQSETPPAHLEPALPHGHGELILIADDEVGIREIAEKTLTRFGYAVLLAANGAEAVSLYAQNKGRVALVLTDMAMPVMDGLATIVALRSLDPNANILGSSGMQDDAMIAKAKAAGVYHFISKPYTAESLLQAIYTALNPTLIG